MSNHRQWRKEARAKARARKHRRQQRDRCRVGIVAVGGAISGGLVAEWGGASAVLQEGTRALLVGGACGRPNRIVTYQDPCPERPMFGVFIRCCRHLHLRGVQAETVQP